MLGMFQAERLKLKRSMAKKLLVFAPIIAILYGFIAPVGYLVNNAYNWWYVMIFPGLLTLFAVLINTYEEKKLHYRAVFPLPISLRKFWFEKIFITVYYLNFSNGVLWIITVLLNTFILPNYGKDYTYTVGELALASLVIIVTTLWQIPFCLWLTKRIGFTITLIINLMSNFILGVVFATTSCWWLCPYSWGIRLMVPILKILPSGLKAGIAGAPSLPTSFWSIVISLCLAVILFVSLTVLSASWFEKQEVK